MSWMRVAGLLGLLGLLLGLGCGAGTGGPDPIASSLSGLPEQDFPMDAEPQRRRIEVAEGRLVGLEGRVSRLRAGPVTFNVVNRVEGARSDVDGLDLSQLAIALWLRGRGDARHRLPQHSIGPVNSGVQEDWAVDLPPGDYLLSVTLGGASEAVLRVR
jgi:hypothetical protein